MTRIELQHIESHFIDLEGYDMMRNLWDKNGFSDILRVDLPLFPNGALFLSWTTYSAGHMWLEGGQQKDKS